MSGRAVFRSPIAAAAAAVVASILTVAVSAAPALAGPRPRVGPHQAFDGLVNGHRGGATVPVSIFVSCFGPIKPGETGHPVDGQTVEILPAASVGGHTGNTGDAATSIEAFFGAPPPAGHPASPGAAARTTVSFRRYALERPVPRALELPCSGTGQVTFVPFPRTPPTSKPSIVPVQYVAQP
jgi:hypothetical protein